ncbi:hypothetical protein I6F35_11950 [Bradyrhizobium sp. BRP22]|uniref:hypothetical protein n=1 Tax=Bradyrhizobium sp. BRP22 TaxID=2793821 RepID=UPI001CD5D874|nr:hypothetical protein [Bradyrhizobium sp. BRP22]MCA1453926.1 hypothetical protein [Bradyrhizobium sp. BRP22]
MSFIEGMDRGQVALLPPCIDDYIAPDALVRVVDEFVGGLDLVGPASSARSAPQRGGPDITANYCEFLHSLPRNAPALRRRLRTTPA